MSGESKASEDVRCSICGNIIKDESIEVELLHAIIKRENNTKYLVKYGNEYSTVLIPTKTFVEKAVFEKGKEKDEASKIEGYLLNYRMSLIKPHMEEYKENRLGIKENGEYRGKKYPHILPETEKEKNLIDAECGYIDSLKDELKKIKTHQGFSHLNSSQAFALNFFVPIIKENKLDEFLDFPHATILQNDEETGFEKVLELFGKKEGTNFDVCFKTEQNKYITFEVKYSEENFGSATKYKDEPQIYDDKWDAIYKEAMENLLSNSDSISKEKFFKQYQLWRNLIYTTKDCDVCFIFPKFRTDLTAEVKAARALCKEEYQTKIHIFYVDDFVDKMIKETDEKLKKHYEEFKIKYLDLENEVQESKK